MKQSLNKLPLLQDRQSELEKCVYCPKLCRASCPVSNATPNEALTPWGKMSGAYFLARGDLQIEAENAEPAWACTGCMGCKQRCDHKNDVTSTLYDARAGLFDKGAAPEAAVHVARTFQSSAHLARERAVSLSNLRPSREEDRLLIGCGYYPENADPVGTGRTSATMPLDEQALRVADALLGSPPRPIEACCGIPLLHAGDREGFKAAAQAFAREVSSARSIVAVDPGCARALSVEYPKIGVSVPTPTLLVDVASRRLGQLKPLGVAPPRYHDPCALGRGMGKYAEPRRILERIAGAPPREFQRSREVADCSGGGGLLPQTMPKESDSIAKRRIADHHSEGSSDGESGGVLVTACAASVRRFRASGERAEDIVTWMARSLDIVRDDV